MKIMKAISMMFVLTVITNITLATGNLKVNILPLTAERAVVSILNNTESKFEISVETAYGEILYHNQTRGNSNEYNKVYDFSKLEVGDYKLIVDIDDEISERAFSIDRSKINVGKLKSVVKPFFSFNENILRLAYLNPGNDKLKLSIFDGSELIYNKALENTFSVNEGWSLSKLDQGDYFVVLSAGDKRYNYAVNVK